VVTATGSFVKGARFLYASTNQICTVFPSYRFQDDISLLHVL
jgi:hypothetical protein